MSKTYEDLSSGGVTIGCKESTWCEKCVWYFSGRREKYRREVALRPTENNLKKSIYRF